VTATPATDTPALVPGARVAADQIRFGVADPDHGLAGVRLWQEVGIPGDRLDFTCVQGGWALSLDPPSVQRMQYLLELRHADGRIEHVLDPANPQRVRGVFGDHSVVEMPGYRSPWWLDAPAIDGRTTDLAAPPARGLRRDLPVTVWQPEDATETEVLPLLVVHDGHEMADLASLTRYSAALVASDRLPRHRLALLHPLDRDAWYSASPAYGRSLTRSVLPLLRQRFAVREPVAAAGASLGGLSLLHTEWEHPRSLGGLFLQSGSFFQLGTDPQEEGYPHFWRIHRFVRTVLDATHPPSRPHGALTCGTIEENVHNNRVMARWMSDHDYPVTYAEAPDVHTFTSWRDSFDPQLTDLLHRTWGTA
jgi:enterochelin esterase family protein